MSENLVRSVLKEYIEGDMPGKKDPWPAISAMLPQALDGSAAPLINEQATRAMAAQSQTQTLPGGRRLRVNMAMALIALLVLAGLSAIFVATRQQPSPLAALPLSGEFLPAGTVRHLVYTSDQTVDRRALGGTVATTQQHREEFWLTQGQSHPLMKDLVTVPISATGWINDSGYYEYEPAKGNTVSWSKYDPQLLVTLLPDPEIITKSLQIPSAHLIGNDVLDGRPVVVISYGNADTLRAAPTSTATKGVTGYINTVVTYWIDRATNQLLQFSIENTTGSGAQAGLIEKTVNKIALDELVPRSAFPADFFDFKLPEGTVLFNMETPTPAITPAPPPAGYAPISGKGRFALAADLRAPTSIKRSGSCVFFRMPDLCSALYEGLVVR